MTVYFILYLLAGIGLCCSQQNKPDIEGLLRISLSKNELTAMYIIVYVISVLLWPASVLLYFTIRVFCFFEKRKKDRESVFSDGQSPQNLFRIKPEAVLPKTIKAIQLTESNVLEAYQFIHGDKYRPLQNEMLKTQWEDLEALIVKEGLFILNMKENKLRIAEMNDYIIDANNGDFYPNKPEIFEKVYERIKS